MILPPACKCHVDAFHKMGVVVVVVTVTTMKEVAALVAEAKTICNLKPWTMFPTLILRPPPLEIVMISAPVPHQNEPQCQGPLRQQMILKHPSRNKFKANYKNLNEL